MISLYVIGINYTYTDVSYICQIFEIARGNGFHIKKSDVKMYSKVLLHSGLETHYKMWQLFMYSVNDHELFFKVREAY